MDERFNTAMVELAALSMKERNRREIERAIDRVKEPKLAADDWFRRQWYRAAWQRSHRYSRYGGDAP